MSINKIRVAKDKAALVQALINANEKTSPFQTYVEVMVFAAALGAKRKKKVPLGEISRREPGPIEQEYFATKGYDTLIKLLAIAEIKNIDILSLNEQKYDDERTHIFEEYANGGLEILQEELRGVVDYSDRLLLFLSFERLRHEEREGEFDLTRFLS
jgi:dnd system-associated protein 4